MSKPLGRFASLFKRFHGRAPTKKEIGGFYVPQTLIRLGRAVAVVYECDKLHGGGDGKQAHYIHEFETPVALFMDERGKTQLYIIGPKLIVTEDGIEN